MSSKPIPEQRGFSTPAEFVAWMDANPGTQFGGLLVTTYRERTPDETREERLRWLGLRQDTLQRAVDETATLEKTIKRDTDRLAHLKNFIPAHKAGIKRDFGDLLEAP